MSMLTAATIDSATITRLRGTVQALFLETLEQSINPMVARLGIEGPSIRAYEGSYAWLGQVPAIEEFLGERVVAQLKKAGFTITNKRWQGAIGIPVVDISLNALGMHTARVQDLAVAVRQFPLELFVQLMIDGDAKLCYDGQYFFDIDHVDGDSGTISNKLTGTGTTDAQIQADYIAAQKAMGTFKGDKGKFLRLKGDLVVCPLELEPAFRRLFGAGLLSSTTNIFQGECDVLGLPDLSADDANDWYLFCTKRRMKAFIYQQGLDPEFDAQDQPGSDAVFNQDEVRYGVKLFSNGGYGLWQMGAKTTNA